MIERKIKCAAWVMAITVLTAGCGADDSESRPLDIDDVSVTSEAENIRHITLDEVKTAALFHAGLSGDNVVFIKTMLENDDGKATYDIKFTADNSKYEYEIDVVSGTVLEFSSEIISDKTVDESYSSAEISGQITIDEAKVIALKHAGFTEEQVLFTKSELDHDDGMTVYEIEFNVNGIEYEYKIYGAGD